MKSSIRIVMAVLALSVILAISCAPASPTVAPPAPTGPKYGGTLHLILAATLQNVDPVKQTGPHSWALAKLYGDTLIEMLGKDNNDVTLVPRLAKSWEMSADALSYTFHLQEGVKFQNVPPANGRILTSSDVKYSFERIIDPNTKSPVASLFASLAKVEAPDTNTVIFILKTPDPGFLFNLCGGPATICAKEVIDKDGDASKVMVGTGPFIAIPEESVKDNHYYFRKNPDYFQKGLPYVDRVEVTVMQEEQMQIASFRSGKIDQVIATPTVYDSLKSIPKISVSFPIETLCNALYFSPKQNAKLWGDINVRRALMYAIDYDALIKAAANGAGYRTWWLDPKYKEWGATQPQDMPKRDIAKAKELLTQAGYPNGFTTSILQHMARLDAWGGTVEPIAAMLKDVGIDAKIKPTDHASFISATRLGDFELISGVSWLSPALDPDGGLGLSRQYGSKAQFGLAGMYSPKIDELITAQKAHMANPATRKNDLKQLFAQLDQEQCFVPLYVQWKYHVTQPWVKGWKGGDVLQQLGYHEVAHVWLDK